MTTPPTPRQASGNVIIARTPQVRRRWRWWFLLVPVGFLLGTALGVGEKCAEQLGFGVNDLYRKVTNTETHFAGRKQVNILLMGTDNAGGGNADSLMLARVDTERHRLAVISIPRDTRVKIPGHTIQKINAAHAIGGYRLQEETVSQVLGVPVDYYISLNSQGLAKLVEAVGGLDIDVEKRMHYTDASQDLFIDLQPGLQHLDGRRAVGYVRFRHDQIGDIGRMGRQQKFVRALGSRIVSPEQLLRLPAVIGALLQAAKTNLPTPDLIYLAHLAKEVDPQNVPMATLPAEPITLRRVSYLQLQPAAAKRVIAEVLYAQPCEVDLVDATGDDARAEQTAGIVRGLQQAGFRVVETRIAPRQAVSRVVEHLDRPEKARKLLRLLPCAQIVHQHESAGQPDFTIEVGRDVLASPGNAAALSR